MRSKCCWGYIYKDENGVGGYSYRCAQCGKLDSKTISDHETGRLKKEQPEKYGDHPYIPFLIPNGDR